MLKTRHVASLILFAALLVSGCSRSEVELGNVRGQVTMDGEPLPDATVRFIPVAGGRSALGRTDAEGRYEMLYSATASGAIVGKVRVEITVAEEATDERGNTYMKPETVPARYNVNSELTAEVTPDSNVIDFPLTSE